MGKKAHEKTSIVRGENENTEDNEKKASKIALDTFQKLNVKLSTVQWWKASEDV